MLVVQGKIEAIKQDKEATAESMLRTQFQMELIVYTQDSTYSSSLSERKKEEEEEDLSIQKHNSKRMIVYCPDNHATLQEMMLHLKSYYSVSIDLSLINLIVISKEH